MVALNFKKIISLLILATFCCASAQAITVPSTIEIDGKKLPLEVDKSFSGRIKTTKVTRRDPDTTRRGPKVHTLKAYGSMYVTFLISMIMTEKWYCDKRVFAVTATDFEETPTCVDEMYQMAKDPSMHVGILAMTYTSLAFTDWSNRKSRNILLKTLGKKAKTPLKLIKTFNQSVGMGFGITAQTLINSTYNSPSIGKCFKKIKSTILSGGTAEDAMEKEKICKDAWESFISKENGTMSEIHIAVLSLIVSTTATAGVMTTVRGAAIVMGHVLGKSNFIGWSVTGAMMATNFLIEFFDRAIEKYIRAFYHNRRSKNLLNDDFEQLMSDLSDYKEKGSLVGSERVILPCSRANGRCKRREFKNVQTLPIMESLKSYIYNINYRRRALLNTFLDSQSRWKQKLSGANETLANYKDFLNIIMSARELRAESGANLEGTDYNYNPFFAVGSELRASYPEEGVEGFYKGPLSLRTSQTEQIVSSFKAILDTSFFRSITESAREQTVPMILKRTIEKTIELAEKNQAQELRLSLWRTKEISNAYFTEKFSMMTIRTAEEIRIVETFKNILVGVSSFNPLMSVAMFQFESKGLSFDSSQKEESGPSTVARRKGVSIDTEGIDVLQLHESSVEQGVEHSEFPLANLLLHSACNANDDVIFDYSEGDISKVTLPHLIDFSIAGGVECSPREFLPQELLSDLDTEDDFFFTTQSKEITALRKNAAMHSLYKYNGKTYIGLLDLLTDPAVPFRWETTEDLKAFWDDKIVPKYLNLLSEGKQNYQNMLFNEYALFERGTDGELSYLQPHTALTSTEISARTSNLTTARRTGFTRYYEKISAGQTFLDQVRVSAYVLEQLGIQNERTEMLANLMTDLEKMLLAMDIPAYSQPSVHSVFSLATINQNPMIEIMGMDRLVELGETIDKTAKTLATAAKALESVPSYTGDEEVYGEASEAPIKAMIEKEIFTSVQEMFNTGVVGEIFTDYLTGEGFIYSQQ
jgi:hypothetical protein